MRNIGKKIGYALLWVALALIVVWAIGARRAHDEQQLVEKFEVVVSRNCEHILIDGTSLKEWIEAHDMSPEGEPISLLDIGALESFVATHSAVESVNVTSTYDGDVFVSVVQRNPIARLRLEGYDMYLTADGSLFPVSDGYSVRVPVVTGLYTPLFDNTYSGKMSSLVRDSLAKIDGRIDAIEEKKLPHLRQRQQNNERLNQAKNRKVKKSKFMSQRRYKLEVAENNRRREAIVASCTAKEQQISDVLAGLDAEQMALRLKQQQLRDVERDFAGLVEFITAVNGSEWWSSEFVQLVLSGGENGRMEITAIPRSGKFAIEFGKLENLGEKFNTLRLFYNEVLPNVGWDKHRVVSLKYDNQVVCR